MAADLIAVGVIEQWRIMSRNTAPRVSRRSFLTLPMAGVALKGAQTSSHAAFPEPQPEARMTAFYWWFGPSQTKAQVGRELEAMRTAGIGGVYLFPCYPLTADDEVNTPYLSPKFLDVLRFTLERASELSITVDLLVG